MKLVIFVERFAEQTSALCGSATSVVVVCLRSAGKKSFCGCTSDTSSYLGSTRLWSRAPRKARELVEAAAGDMVHSKVEGKNFYGRGDAYSERPLSARQKNEHL